MPQTAADTTPHLLPAFWPFSEHHAVGHLALDAQPPSNAEEVLPLLLGLAAQSDALRSLQTADGAVVSERGAAALCEEMVAGLRELAELVDEESAAAIRLRAAALAGEAGQRETTLKIATEGMAPPLEIVCGPLCTWRPKTRSPLHSFLAAARNEPQQEVLDALDASLQEAIGELRRDLDAPGLDVTFALPMNVTDLIVSAGEAAGHPKHFAYFLPEDEGVDDLPIEEQRTLYLHNVHLARYATITIPLGEALVDGPLRAGDVPVDATLMTWIRGHDHGHNLVLPETDYGWTDALGLEPFMALQEAIADVYGFLLAVSEPWLAASGATSAQMCATHMSDLLHYMRRGPWHHGDAGAAYVELNFLAANGFVDVDATGRVSWTEDGVRRGMTELAKALTRSTVAAPDERPSRELLDSYGWPDDAAPGQALDAPAGRTLTAIREELAHVPTSVAFYRTDAPRAAGAKP
jgi:hypothetical protein